MSGEAERRVIPDEEICRETKPRIRETISLGRYIEIDVHEWRLVSRPLRETTVMIGREG